MCNQCGNNNNSKGNKSRKCKKSSSSSLRKRKSCDNCENIVVINGNGGRRCHESGLLYGGIADYNISKGCSWGNGFLPYGTGYGFPYCTDSLGCGGLGYGYNNYGYDSGLYGYDAGLYGYGVGYY
jgi:hypothetical protein